MHNDLDINLNLHNNNPIGIFDSGVGGLTIANAIANFLPYENIAYVGDTKNAPWGDKPVSEIISYVQKICEFLLLDLNCKIIVIACNTAPSIALDKVRAKIHSINSNIPIINVVDPLIEYVGHKYNNCNLGLIGTTRTINSNYFQNKIKNTQPTITLKTLATPKLVPIIENGKIESSTTKTVLQEYLSPFLPHKIKALILGCTHYSFMQNPINNFFYNSQQKNVELINSATLTAIKVKEMLNYKGYNTNNTKKTLSKKQLFISKDNDFFKQIAAKYFVTNFKIKNVSLSANTLI